MRAKREEKVSVEKSEQERGKKNSLSLFHSSCFFRPPLLLSFLAFCLARALEPPRAQSGTGTQS